MKALGFSRFMFWTFAGLDEVFFASGWASDVAWAQHTDAGSRLYNAAMECVSEMRGGRAVLLAPGQLEGSRVQRHMYEVAWRDEAISPEHVSADATGQLLWWDAGGDDAAMGAALLEVFGGSGSARVGTAQTARDALEASPWAHVVIAAASACTARTSPSIHFFWA